MLLVKRIETYSIAVTTICCAFQCGDISFVNTTYNSASYDCGPRFLRRSELNSLKLKCEFDLLLKIIRGTKATNQEKILPTVSAKVIDRADPALNVKLTFGNAPLLSMFSICIRIIDTMSPIQISKNHSIRTLCSFSLALAVHVMVAHRGINISP